MYVCMYALLMELQSHLNDPSEVPVHAADVMRKVQVCMYVCMCVCMPYLWSCKVIWMTLRRFLCLLRTWCAKCRYVCMYVCMYVCKYVSVYVYMFVYTGFFGGIILCNKMCAISDIGYICVYMYVYVCKGTCVHIFVYVCVWVCIWCL
jgi:hypothetical protein